METRPDVPLGNEAITARQQPDNIISVNARIYMKNKITNDDKKKQNKVVCCSR